jgi:hypothetical protein
MAGRPEQEDVIDREVGRKILVLQFDAHMLPVFGLVRHPNCHYLRKIVRCYVQLATHQKRLVVALLYNDSPHIISSACLSRRLDIVDNKIVISDWETKSWVNHNTLGSRFYLDCGLLWYEAMQSSPRIESI